MDRIRLPDTSQLIWLFFKFQGRVSRAAYFLAGLLLAIAQAFMLYRFTLVPEESQEAQMWAVAFWVMVIASLWSNVALGVKRLHDLGKPGIMAVALFIPIVSIVAFVWLCLYPGDPAPNQFGRRANDPD